MLASAPQGCPASNSAAASRSHQSAAAHLRIGARDRELHALVLADRPAEHHALLGVGRRLVDEPAASPTHSAAIRMRSAFMPSRM